LHGCIFFGNSFNERCISIFLNQTFNNDNCHQFTNTWVRFCVLWIIIRCLAVIFKFITLQRHFLSAETLLAVNTHQLAINLALPHSLCLRICDHGTDLTAVIRSACDAQAHGWNTGT
jgi:hypothetical protein